MYHSKTWTYQPLERRPLVGYAPDIRSTDTGKASLLFLSLTWRDLEPEEGRFVFADWERRLDFSGLRRRGQRLVFRLVLDYPAFKGSPALPDWLLERVPARPYRSPFGQGLAPDYGHAELAGAYRRLVLALGQAWGQDGLLAYVELGGLGHWGEWHQLASLGPLPQGDFAQYFYVDPWFQVFRFCRICLRRSFAWLASDRSYNFYHDELGDLAQTRVWLDELVEGGESFDEAQLRGLGESGLEQVCGGEWSSKCLWAPLSPSLLAQMGCLGLSFLGPALPQNVETASVLEACIGYQLWLPQVKGVSSLLGTCLGLAWENQGVAAFPFDWPVYLAWETWRGERGRSCLRVRLSQVGPGQRIWSFAWLPRPLLTYKSLSLSVEDPLAQKPLFIFSQKAEKGDGSLIL